MINGFRTLSARAITRRLRQPRALVVRAWFWLAAQTSDLTEKRRCLEAILALEPGNQWVKAAMARAYAGRAHFSPLSLCALSFRV